MYNLFFRGPLAIFAIFAILSVPAASFAVEARNKDSLIKLLVEESPWNVEWDNATSGRSGTHQITFALGKDGVTLTGMFLGSSRNSAGPLSDIVLKKSCVSLKLSTGSKYDYCLAGDKTLKGPYEGMTSTGDYFDGKAVAKPAAR